MRQVLSVWTCAKRDTLHSTAVSDSAASATRRHRHSPVHVLDRIRERRASRRCVSIRHMVTSSQETRRDRRCSWRRRSPRARRDSRPTSGTRPRSALCLSDLTCSAPASCCPLAHLPRASGSPSAQLSMTASPSFSPSGAPLLINVTPPQPQPQPPPLGKPLPPTRRRSPRGLTRRNKIMGGLRRQTLALARPSPSRASAGESRQTAAATQMVGGGGGGGTGGGGWRRVDANTATPA